MTFPIKLPMYKRPMDKMTFLIKSYDFKTQNGFNSMNIPGLLANSLNRSKRGLPNVGPFKRANNSINHIVLYKWLFRQCNYLTSSYMNLFIVNIRVQDLQLWVLRIKVKAGPSPFMIDIQYQSEPDASETLKGRC